MKAEADGEYFELLSQALGALEWTLLHVVFNVRARTAIALRRHLAQVGIEVPDSVIDSPKWFRAFNGPLSVADHDNGFGGLLHDRLIQLGFQEHAVRNSIDDLAQGVRELCLDVESAVARELRADMGAIGVHVPPSILLSRGWRDVFAREQGELPPGAASVVRDGTDSSVFRAVE